MVKRICNKTFQSLRGILTLNQPIQEGMVQNWDDLEVLWNYVWNQSLSMISNGDSSLDEYKVLASVPPLCPPEDWKRLGEMLLESQGVDGIYLANKSVLSMYGGGRTTGVCVDSGEDMTYIVPCWEGSPIPNATLILKMGGKHVTDRLLDLLANGKYSFPDDNFLLWKQPGKKRSGNRIRIASKHDIVREAKEQFCKINLPKENNNKVEEQMLKLPDGNVIIVGEESHLAPEILFQPELEQTASTNGSCPTGLPELIYESIMRCDEKLRPRLLSNIMLTGGNSMLPELNTRLQWELEKLLPKQTVVRVGAQKGRDNFTWDGGAHLCSLSSFQRLWLSKQDYNELGNNVKVQKAFEQDDALK